MFRRTQDPLRRERSFDYRAVTSYGGPFQTSSSTSFFCNSVQSVLQPQEASLLVWANPVSLAATQGIAFAFSSSGYLDVSVPRVCLLISYEFRLWIPLHYERWVSPFGNLRIKACLQLPEALSVFVPSFIGS
ncbi:hypothetical protein BSNT_06456 [Bacillus subtilis subsp. natto BEST195]|nr:hypothetical protein BSNT_06456 [Bacillus subtilis subsp. natto BEST195]